NFQKIDNNNNNNSTLIIKKIQVRVIGNSLIRVQLMKEDTQILEPDISLVSLGNVSELEELITGSIGNKGTSFANSEKIYKILEYRPEIDKDHLFIGTKFFCNIETLAKSVGFRKIIISEQYNINSPRIKTINVKFPLTMTQKIMGLDCNCAICDSIEENTLLP
ncbi:MAG: hypothetical protein AABY22_27225, partial [Nanoarchaeota archaeon]